MIYIDPTGYCGVRSWDDAGDCLVQFGAWWLKNLYTQITANPLEEAAYFLVIDDINTILDPKASTFDKTLAYAGFIPVSKLIKSGKLIVKLVNSEGRTIERAVNFIGEGTEKVLDSTLSSYERARNLAFDIMGDLGPDSKAYVGRLRSSAGYGKVVGRQSADGKLRWRLDYDPEKGTHINIEDFRNGTQKYVIKFEGNEETFRSLLKHLNQ